MIEANGLKGEINTNIEIKNEFNLTGIQADLNPLVQTVNEFFREDFREYITLPVLQLCNYNIKAYFPYQLNTNPHLQRVCKNEFIPFLKDKVSPKLLAIPEENRVSPNIRIAKGVFENVIDLEPNQETLREMFANLLAGSMDNQKSEEVHPDYARLIAELSEEDAQFLNHLFTKQTGQRIPRLEISITDSGGYSKDYATEYPKEFENHSKFLIDRLISKGLLQSVDTMNTEKEFPTFFEEQEQQMRTTFSESEADDLISFSFKRTVIIFTQFGKAFMEAVT